VTTVKILSQMSSGTWSRGLYMLIFVSAISRQEAGREGSCGNLEGEDGGRV